MNITITGNLTKDVDFKYFESGKVKATFSLAVSSYDYTKKEQVASFYNCEFWKENNLLDKLKKGDKITVTGYLKTTEYNDKKYNSVVVQSIGYQNATAVIGGIVEKEETRYSQNNTAVQFVKLAGEEVTCKILGEKTHVEKGNYYTFVGELTNIEKNLVLNVKNVFANISHNQTKEIVKFAEEEISF